ncbi:MAG TPA: hypothetical protein VHC97_28125 [Thermoanaerobaculia bacterium]|nr:hypothetical protein [Thermoanaerobaculia bacterium]
MKIAPDGFTPRVACFLIILLFAVPFCLTAENPVLFTSPTVVPGGDGGSEPSLAVAQQGRAGERFVSWQVPGEVATSSDGVSFVNRGLPDPAGGGDVTNAIDPAGTFFLGQFCGGAFTLHVCLERSEDGGATWPLRTDFADTHPGAADRPWIEIHPHRSPLVDWNSDHTRVYLEYHTFTPEELAYVTVSADGGRTFSEPKLITSDTNALNASGCNTVPGGVAVDERDGTVYALWLSGNDVAANLLTGCNYTQIGPFNKAWVSVSHDGGDTWTSHLAWQGAFNPLTKIGDNANKIFATIAVDQAGQVHVVLAVRHDDDPVGFVTACQVNAGVCEETPNDTDLLLVTSPDQGRHWTPAAPIEGSSGSYFFPWIAAGSRGIVNAVYYKSASRQPNRPGSEWFIGMARVKNAVAGYIGGPSAFYVAPPEFSETVVDASPIHNGGICTFGVFCTALGAMNGNRRLADSIAVVLDPAGGANLVWTDDFGNPNNAREIHFACQRSGPSAFEGAPELNGCYGPADLSVTQSESRDPVAQGQTLTYHVTVANSGAPAATTSGVVLTDVLPPAATLVSVAHDRGTCGAGSGGTVRCDLGVLPGGTAVTVDVTVSLPAQISGTVTNRVAVTSATEDPNPGNNDSAETTTVRGRIGGP